ncbi:FIG00959768: hypothetical protein [Pseudomonas sp. SHC52]|nr:FIG00959768: hypothetical protein [Pseudomonas sp. SHC52]
MNAVNMKVWAVGVSVAVLLAFGIAWKVQGWRYEARLAQLAGLHKDDLTAISNTAAAQVQAEQAKHLVLEQRLSASEQTHYKDLSDAQSNQARLRDRLATSDLRLSVLLENAGSCSSVPTGAVAGGVVHGGARARLDPAHAQRIIAITDEGDRGLIALQACQAYVKALGQ